MNFFPEAGDQLGPYIVSADEVGQAIVDEDDGERFAPGLFWARKLILRPGYVFMSDFPASLVPQSAILLTRYRREIYISIWNGTRIRFHCKLRLLGGASRMLQSAECDFTGFQLALCE